jgi:hypothetical protein
VIAERIEVSIRDGRDLVVMESEIVTLVVHWHRRLSR